MNASLTRIHKEARSLIWLWTGLTSISLATLVSANHLGPFYATFWVLLRQVGFWLGIPLLAAVSMGQEFQHGTVSLLLVQPVDRLRIWREKLLVLIPAVVSVAFAYFWNGPLYLDDRLPAAAVTWIALALLTSSFWTLVGRSTLNGLLLTLMQGAAWFWLWRWADALLDPGHQFSAEIFYAGIVIALFYGLLLFWLSRRKFVRFQVAGEKAAVDVFASSSASFLRSRPGQPLLNIIRKELRLLGPVWLIAAFAVLGVLSIAAFQFAPDYSTRQIGFFADVWVISLGGLCAILAGSLSMAEERTAGTRAWHRTLPLSSNVQWALKLGVALMTSFVALLISFATAGYAIGADFLDDLKFGLPPGHPAVALLIFSSFFVLAAFWCASVIKGTLRAALLAIPVIALVLLVYQNTFGLVGWLSRTSMVDPLLTRLRPPTLLHLFAESQRIYPTQLEFLLLAPVLVALIQSLRLFRREMNDRGLAIVRRLGGILLVAFMSGVIAIVPAAASIHANRLENQALYEMQEVIWRLALVTPAQAEPMQLTVRDLSKVGGLSATSQILLRDVLITFKREPGGRPLGNRWINFKFIATARFANGLICTSQGDFFQCKPPNGK